VNSVYDKSTHKWTCFKRKHMDLLDKSKLFKAAPPKAAEPAKAAATVTQ
jgi:adenylylsulfate reductase subunit A